LGAIGRAVTDGYDSAQQGVQTTVGVTVGVPVSNLSGYVKLPASYLVLVCMDGRGVVTVCRLNTSYRVINDDNVLDFSLIYAEPFRPGAKN
jgi:hypothetical protein